MASRQKKLDTKGEGLHRLPWGKSSAGKVKEFVDSTKQAIHRNDLAKRADLERLTTALMCGDV